jgi:hypothetical protein
MAGSQANVAGADSEIKIIKEAKLSVENNTKLWGAQRKIQIAAQVGNPLDRI